MRSEFVGVWPEMWREVWLPLIDRPLREGEDGVPEDIFCELYRELAKALKVQLSIEVLADVIDDPIKSQETFEKTMAADLSGERAVVMFLEAAHAVLDDLGGDDLSNRYFNLLSDFIEKFNLRYDLRRPCVLCPTLAGVFASLISDLRAITSQETHLDSLMKDFEESVQDLRIDCSDRRIKTSIQKQVNLLEALGRVHPGVERKTLGSISKQIRNWPHEEVMFALQSLYTFTCDYPGIRHGGTPTSALRAVDMRDMVAISIVLIGFTPYLTQGLNPDVMYRRT